MAEIYGWFPPENREKLAELIDRHHAQTVIELGSFMGQSAAWFAERVQFVTCIDPFKIWDEPSHWEGMTTRDALVKLFADHGWPHDFYPVFQQNMIDAGVWPRVTAIQATSLQAANDVAPADLVYIDALHDYESARADILLYLPKASKVISGDDFIVHDGFGVIEAVNELLPGRQTHGPFWWYEKESNA